MDPIEGVKFIYGDISHEDTVFEIQQALKL